MIRTMALCTILCVVIYGAGAEDDLPSMRFDECIGEPAELARAHSAWLVCAWLIVPEFREPLESSYNMELFLLRIRSQNPARNAPILHLAGGPGFAPSSYLVDWLESDIDQDYDIILLDPRGMGLSVPSLHCSEASRAETVDWIRACRERIAAGGMDLTAVSSSAIVRDLDELLQVMGIRQVNVYGHSYGSRLALQLAEYAPQRVRSLVLDGVFPPPKNSMQELARNFDLALQRLLDDCVADETCSRTYPNLGEQFMGTVTQLDAIPADMTFKGKRIGLVMNGADFVGLVRTFLTESADLPLLPALIATFARGEYDMQPILEIAENQNDESYLRSYSAGAHYTLVCAEDLSYPAGEPRQATEGDITPHVAAAFREIVKATHADCQSWDVPVTKAARIQPVTSDIPSLLLSGAYDPVTPSVWGNFAAEHLENSWHFVFPNAGHDVLGSVPCATDVMTLFLADPHQRPAADCFVDLEPPKFVKLDLSGN